MLILGIDTATLQVGAAIGGNEGVLASAHSSRGQRHAETLTPAIDFIRRQARIDLTEISVVAVDVGPGLFTGLRVGIASAKAIAYALRVPMIGISSLDLVAFPLRFSPKLIAAVIDARRSEVYYALYRQVPGGIQRVNDPVVASPSDLAAELQARSEECLVVGDGAIRYREIFDDVSKVEVVKEGLAYPSATALVRLAHSRAMREEWVNPWEVEPMYLRLPDAEINWSTREGA